MFDAAGLLQYNTPAANYLIISGGGRLPYQIQYSPDAEDHLRTLTARQQAIVLDEAITQLTFQPTNETKNRKPMRPNSIATWELRIGNLRVYYEVEEEPETVVYILAVGVKERNRVRIGRQVIDL